MVNAALDWAVFLHLIHNSLLSVAIVLMLIIINAKRRPTRELPVQTHSRTQNALIRPHNTD